MHLKALGFYVYSDDPKLDDKKNGAKLDDKKDAPKPAAKKMDEKFGPFEQANITTNLDEEDDHPLTDLVKEFLPRISTVEKGTAKRFQSEKYHHYVAKLEKTNIVIGISTRSILDKTELNMLSRAIEKNYLSRATDKDNKDGIPPLDEILRNNTHTYTGTSQLLFNTQLKITRVTEATVANVRLVQSNIADLKKIETNTIRLHEKAKEFLDKAKQTNNCCFGYVPNPKRWF